MRKSEWADRWMVTNSYLCALRVCVTSNCVCFIVGLKKTYIYSATPEIIHHWANRRLRNECERKLKKSGIFDSAVSVTFFLWVISYTSFLFLFQSIADIYFSSIINFYPIGARVWVHSMFETKRLCFVLFCWKQRHRLFFKCLSQKCSLIHLAIEKKIEMLSTKNLAITIYNVLPKSKTDIVALEPKYELYVYSSL